MHFFYSNKFHKFWMSCVCRNPRSKGGRNQRKSRPPGTFRADRPDIQNHIDAASGGSFLSLSVLEAKVLVEKIASNQSWKGDRQQQPRKGVHQIDSIDMLAAKMDLLMKRLESPH